MGNTKIHKLRTSPKALRISYRVAQLHSFESIFVIWDISLTLSFCVVILREIKNLKDGLKKLKKERDLLLQENNFLKEEVGNFILNFSGKYRLLLFLPQRQFIKDHQDIQKTI